MEDPREDLLDAQRKIVFELIKKLLEQGCSGTTIGFAMSDPNFVRKFFSGHRFKLSTLLRAERMLPQVKPPSLSSRIFS